MLKNKYITQDSNSRLYQIPVPIIGLTGGIATGKSTVAKILREQGFAIIDADALVKNVYQKKSVKDFISKTFPQAINNNEIDFKILRQIAFNKAENIALIEKEIYQHLPEEFKKAFNLFPTSEFIFYDVPLLFEKGLDLLVDSKVCVYAPSSIQLARLIERDQINPADAQKILDRQMSIEDKKIKSDLIIDNSKDLNFLESQIKAFLLEIQK